MKSSLNLLSCSNPPAQESRRPQSALTQSLRAGAAALAVLGASACASVAPLQQVVLSPPQAERAANAADHGPSGWEVQRVRVPEYLDGYDVQLRTDDYVLTRMANAKWAERLPVAMTRLLQQSIDAQWGGARKRGYEVNVSVDSFEPQPSGQVVLAARWRVTDSRSEELVARDNTVIQKALPAGPRSPAKVGRIMSEMVRELATQIVAKAG